MSGPILCPECGGSDFEKRGDVRCYLRLGPDLEEDSWTTPIETLELDDDAEGNPTIYCVDCASEYTETELRKEQKEASR